MLCDLRNVGVTGKEAEARLDEVGITANKNAIPYDPEKPFIASGVRIGTPAITTCGMKEDEAREIARLIVRALKDTSEETQTQIKDEVRALTSRFRPYPDVQ
jgi:glycine hydroxymethyltransferase